MNSYNGNTQTIHLEFNTDDTFVMDIRKIFFALIEKDYNPILQITGYMQTGDPSYITKYNNARKIIEQYDNNDLMLKFVEYFGKNEKII